MTLVDKAFRLTHLLFSTGIRSTDNLRHILGIASSAAEDISDEAADVRAIPPIPVSDLEPNQRLYVKLHAFKGVPASITPLEAYALGLLAKRHAARRVFEFGTYKGVSTTQIASNLPEDGKVVTLDLPDDGGQTPLLTISKESEKQIAAESGKGALIPEELRSKIEFVRQDSATFDPRPYAASMDLVFVDGAHSADYVKNDSEKGWDMLRSGGVLVWHDCVPSHAAVVDFVKRSGWPATRILGTSLAFAVKP